MKKSVITIVLNNFVYDSRVLRESISLKKAGYDIQIVAVLTENLPERERIHDISVHRIHLKTRKLPKYKIFQLLKYIEFTYKFSKEYRKTNILHCNDLETLPIGVFLKIFINRRLKIVYDAHEFETERKPNQKKIVKKFLTLFEKILIKYADKVITVSESIANEYTRRYRIEKPALVLNCPVQSVHKSKNIFREIFHLPERTKIFLYQGGLMKRRGIEKIIETFKVINDMNKVVVFMGYGPLAKEIRYDSAYLRNIFLHPPVSPELLLEYTASADYGLMFINNDTLSYYYCLPNKFFEYIMAGLPVIASDLYEIRKIIEKYHIGLVITENSACEIARTINELDKIDTDKMRDNVKKVSKIYNWNNQEKTLINIYKGLH